MSSPNMNAMDLLVELEALDVKLSVENGRLRYNAPKGVLSEALLAQLVAQKEQVLAWLVQRGEEQARDEAPIALQPRGRGLQLSSAQQRFWFLDRLDQGNSAAFVMPPVVLRLTGVLHVEALQRALEAVVRRHEVLRSAFRIEDGHPVQVPLPMVEIALPLRDISSLDADAQEREMARVIRTEALTPFDLQRGDVLLRAQVLRLRPVAADLSGDHLFILTMHHIISDGWSMGILVQELSQYYRAFAAGQSFALPPLAIQYADYAHWERSRLSGELLARQQSYWLKQLAGAPTLLELPTDHQRPRVRSNRGQTEFFQLGREFADPLTQLCARAGVTPFMALLAAFGVLLCRYTDQEDLVIGSPIAVRPHVQSEPLIGLFLNTLALRIDLSGNPGFEELLGRVKRMSLKAFEHRDLPFDQLLHALGVERSLVHTPLFQVLFALQNAPMGEVTLEGLHITPMPTESIHAPFDLVLSLEENAQGIAGLFRYNTDLFEQPTIQRMLGHFKALLSGVLQQPTAPIRNLPLLSADEMAQICDWRGGVAQFPVTQTLHGRFAAQAAQRPDAVAVRYEDGALSYRQLDQRANQVAQRLLRQGVAPGSHVGLCVERSLELVIGILGILKAGCAYIPLDPSYPEDRLQYIVADAGVTVVLTYRAAPDLGAVTTIDLADAALAEEPTAAPPIDVALDATAYVIYTSGSTGKPKGVAVSHANVLRLFLCSESWFGFGPDDVWSLFHSYAFDFSVWELWGALLYGGQVVVVPYAISRSPEHFLGLLADTGVTVLNQTPSAFRQLIDVDNRLPQPPRLALKWVVFGGEALDPRSLARWVERRGLDQPQLINMYGITETTVHVTYYRIQPEDIEEGGSLIGQPLPDLSVDLVDRYGQPVPLGVGGEMLVGGAGVAKGYLNLPEMTAARFVAAETSGAVLPAGVSGRLYRSGDLARRRPDGRLEYLGRMDQQVKIRGFRIELGEIESCVAKHPAIADGVVIARKEAEGARLVAYVAPKSWPAEGLAAELRGYLALHLPDYMVPAVVMVLERLPLTTNGKIDRKALPDPDVGRSQTTQPFVAPRTPIESLLAGMWGEVLGIAQVGIDDNFFELGGDSIRGAILMNKIQERLGSVVFVVALFEAPTIRQFVDYLRAHYPEGMAKLGDDQAGGLVYADAPRADEAELVEFRRLIVPIAPYPISPKKNPRAVFVLSPPRSGSTLLRVLLGGHEQLFSPPELELLGFNTLAQRAEVCSGRDAMWLEGTLRAVMEALGVDADEAKRLMAERESTDLSVQAFYGELQSWLGGRMLVDKSPSYALDLDTLQRIEDYFEQPLYLHLHRHPYGMISSFEEAKLNQIFFRYPHQYSVRRLAELIWLHSHRNIEQFLAGIPAERQMPVSFEDMTSQPQATVERLCRFLGIDFRPEMLGIYDPSVKKKRMTDGVHAESLMLGDVKFHTHQRIDPAVADRWREVYKENFLGEPSWAMAEKLGYRRLTASISAPIQPQGRSGDLPLSFAQQRLWFLDQLEGAGTAYNMPVVLRVRGPLQPQVLAASFRAIAERHEVLRSHFETVDGEPVARIAATPAEMQVVDLQGVAESEVQQRVRADAERAFDLAQGPLFRSSLYVLGEQHFLVLVNMHHIVSDGWSMGVLVREWSDLYNALAAGQPSPLPPLPIQYVDYALWQRQHLTGEGLERQVAYWRSQLAGAPALLELPTDRARPPIQRYRGDTLAVGIDGALTAALKKQAEQSGVSLYMLLLAAFGVLLARYSGQQDICIGSPTANRSRSEVEPLIGFFVNTLVMRLAIAPETPFSELLLATRQMALAAYAHQDVPFEQLVEQLRPERNLSYSPLFQVMFSLQNTPAAVPALADLELAEIPLHQVIAKYDLTLSITERRGEMEAAFEYNSDLFDSASINRMAGHYRNILTSVVATPQAPVGKLNLLTEVERMRICAEWNQTEVVYPAPHSIHGLFEAQAQRTPDAIAVCFGATRLSYRELELRASRLAGHLRASGVQPGQLTAICLDRSADLLVALLAILKAGSAYVPLDPTYPAERIRYILQDAQVGLLLTQSHWLPHLPEQSCPTLCLDQPYERLGSPISGEATAPESLAYVIYTSGSTGNPKGVMISHGAAANFLQTMREAPGITPSDTLLAVTTICFDIAVLELYLPLTVGARVVIADEATTRDAAALMALMTAEQVTMMQATPATWRLLLAAGWAGHHGLKIMCGGEALPSALAKPMFERCASLWNMYGPTETTVWSSVRRVTPVELEQANVPIGRPIANTRMYVLDAALNPQPVNVAGELYIGGDGLANGYLNRPDLTAERFINDPFVAGAKMYWTGDLARFLPDGSIDYMGRIDQQVKVRGFRVELGEVEHAVGKQPGIQVCAVALDNMSDGNTRLVAYYVGAAQDPNLLRQALLELIPDYMVPSLFVALPTMPLTPNGKIDRRALQLPEHLVHKGQNDSLGFRDRVELDLVRIWEDVLNIRPIGIRDNFFAMGGHSIIAVKLMARIAQQFGRQLPLASLFQGATIEQMATLLRDGETGAEWSSLVPIQPQGTRLPFFCVAGAGGNVVYFSDLARSMGNDQPFYGLQPPGLDGITPPHTTVEGLAAHYIEEIRRVQPEGPYFIGGHSFGGLVAYEMAKRLREAGQNVKMLALIDTPAPHFFHATGNDWNEARWLVQVSEIVSHLYDVDLAVSQEELEALPEAEQLAVVHGKLIAAGVLPEGTGVAYFRGFVSVYKANLRIDYAAKPLAADIAVVLLRSLEEQPDQLTSEQFATVRATPALGWEAYVGRPIQVLESPGDHLTMMRAPNTDALAALLNEALAEQKLF